MVFVVSDDFQERLRPQANDDVIKHVCREMSETGTVTSGRLKRVRNQLRLEDGVLTKSGRPVVPSRMQKYVVTEFHKVGDAKSHFGMEKTYEHLKQRFYWPNMFESVRNILISSWVQNLSAV